jgi:hypothetical protein
MREYIADNEYWDVLSYIAIYASRRNNTIH